MKRAVRNMNSLLSDIDTIRKFNLKWVEMKYTFFAFNVSNNNIKNKSLKRVKYLIFSDGSFFKSKIP